MKKDFRGAKPLVGGLSKNQNEVTGDGTRDAGDAIGLGRESTRKKKSLRRKSPIEARIRLKERLSWWDELTDLCCLCQGRSWGGILVIFLVSGFRSGHRIQQQR